MDAIDNVFDPLRDFAKDSLRLVKRCHKPDRKGTCHNNFEFIVLFFSDLICQYIDLRFILKFRRIHEGCVPYGDRIRCHGIRRFLRQVDLHPYQQYYCWIWIRYKSIVLIYD